MLEVSIAKQLLRINYKVFENFQTLKHCRLYGSYESLTGGNTSIAMEDLTGGLPELIDITERLQGELELVEAKKTPPLFQLMLAASERCSLMATYIRVLFSRMASNLIEVTHKNK